MVGGRGASSWSPEALQAEIGKTGAPTVPKDESLTSTSTAASVGVTPRSLNPAPAPEWRPPSLLTLGRAGCDSRPAPKATGEGW